MDPSEKDRRLVGLVHVVFLASIGVYAVVLWIARRGGSAPLDPGGRAPALGIVLLALGAGEISWANWLGRRQLSRGSRDALSKVRSFFFLRFGAAEATAVFGLMLGFLGGSVAAVGLLFALSAAALVLAAPSRAAWNEAMALASGEDR